MTTHEINLLIERYLDGETTLAEERELALAVQREDRPAEWAIIAEMLGELTLDEAIYDEIMALRAPKPAKRLTKLWPRAAAACVAIAFALSYNIKKEEPQEMAKVEPPLPAKNAPSEPVLSCDWSHDRAAAPHVKSLPSAAETAAATPASEPDTTSEAPQPEPLPEVEPQLIAEAQESTPQPEDLALCMALLAEVEARAIMLQQPQQPHPLTPPYNGGEWSLTPINGNSDNVVSTPSLSWRDGVGLLLLDELLANIQQQSNRPELSL